jgi:Ca2+-binding RTX toxin-like protein
VVIWEVTVAIRNEVTGEPHIHRAFDDQDEANAFSQTLDDYFGIGITRIIRHIDDFITGGTGSDALTGGLGNDSFIYVATTESPVGNTRDTITDFNTLLDKIDVAAIEANTNLAGDQAFTFIGTAAFTALGQVRYAAGLVQFNNTGNNNADMEITLTGAPNLVAGGFIL